MDAGYYRGTNTDQDSRFTDKEKKLLKQMKFEPSLDTKVDFSKLNIDVIKPWITGKLNEILGMEDDVVVEYVFSQLEIKDLNPKIMQINLTGFLNARQSRIFMGELWAILVEAQNSQDGIPTSLIEKKMKELKTVLPKKEEKDRQFDDSDWKHRYKSLTGGRYGAVDRYGIRPEVDEEDDRRDRRRERDRDWSPRRDRDYHRDRRSPPDRRFIERNDRDRLERNKDRDERSYRDNRGDRDRGRNSRDRDRDRDVRDRRERERSRESPPRRRIDSPAKRSPSPPAKRRRNSSESAEESPVKKEKEESDNEPESYKKKKKKHRHDSEEESDGETKKKAKKHKKEKKKKKNRDSE